MDAGSASDLESQFPRWEEKWINFNENLACKITRAVHHKLTIGSNSLMKFLNQLIFLTRHFAPREMRNKHKMMNERRLVFLSKFGCLGEM